MRLHFKGPGQTTDSIASVWTSLRLQTEIQTNGRLGLAMLRVSRPRLPLVQTSSLEAWSGADAGLDHFSPD